MYAEVQLEADMILIPIVFGVLIALWLFAMLRQMFLPAVLLFGGAYLYVTYVKPALGL